MDNVFLFANMQEKKEGKGEDSDPILFSSASTILLGVFDGMGGAGSTKCESEFSNDGVHKTKAYVASRIVRNTIEEKVKEDSHFLTIPDLSEKLVTIIKERFSIEKMSYPPKVKTGLRSSLIKDYPTTLAMVGITKTKDGNMFNIDSFWAGDSRNYLWTQEGLFQISLDDINGDLDPMQNLHEDASLSNCVYADGSFHINHKRITLPDDEKFILITATDGCFGYWTSPMEFEKTMRETLRLSEGTDEWNANLTKAIASVSGDDFSYSCAVFGFKDFKELKYSMIKPSKLIKKYFSKIDYNQREIKKAEEKIYKMKLGIERASERVWLKYKDSYLKYMNGNEER